MSATEVSVSIRLEGREVFTAAEAPAATTEQQRTLSAAARGYSARHNSTSTPAVSSALISLEITIGAGITTLDLAAIAALALPAAATRTVDLTGKKIVDFIIRTKSDNAGAVTIAPGASNPYPLFGAGNEMDVGPGRVICSAFADVASDLPAVAGAVKQIDISGTQDDVVYIDLYAG